MQIDAKFASARLEKSTILVEQGNQGAQIRQYIDVKPGAYYEVNVEDDKGNTIPAEELDIIAKKVGQSLEVVLNDTTLLFDDYFHICSIETACLVSLPAAEEELYFITDDILMILEDGAQVVYFYGEESFSTSEFSEIAIAGTNIASSSFSISPSVLGLGLLGGGGSGGGGGVIPAIIPKVISTTLGGVGSAGMFNIANTISNAVEVYKADGTLLGTGALKTNGAYNGILKTNGAYDITLNDTDYRGVAYIRLKHQGVTYKDEATDKTTSLDFDLYAVTIITSGSNDVRINAMTTIAAKVAGIVNAGTNKSTDLKNLNLKEDVVRNANKLIKDAFGLKGDILTTGVDTINSTGDENSIDAGATESKEAGYIAAAIAGYNEGTGSSAIQAAVIEVANDISKKGGLSATTADRLLKGAETVSDAIEAGDEESKMKVKLNSLKTDNVVTKITEIKLLEADDTGVSDKDLITKDNDGVTVKVTAKLDAYQKLWGSIDNGKSWIIVRFNNTATDDLLATDSFVTNLLEGSHLVKFAITPINDTSGVAVNSSTVVENKVGGIAAQQYTLDTTAATIESVNIDPLGTEVIVTLSEKINADSGNNLDDFSVKIGAGNTLNDVDIIGFSVDSTGKKITLTLKNPITVTQNVVKVKYIKDTDVTKSIKDIAGNELEGRDYMTVAIEDVTGPQLHATTNPSIALTGGGDTLGDTIKLTLTFDDNVKGLVSGTDSTVIKIGDTGVQAVWSGVEGEAIRTLTFTIGDNNIGNVTIDKVALKDALMASIKDNSGNNFYTSSDISSIDGDTLPTGIDTVRPAISLSVPEALSTTSNIAFTIDDVVVPGATGKKISIWKKGTGGAADTEVASYDIVNDIDTTSSAAFSTTPIPEGKIRLENTTNATKVEINVADFTGGYEYYIKIDEGTFKDHKGNEFSAITDTTAIGFEALNLNTTINFVNQSGVNVIADNAINIADITNTNITGNIAVESGKSYEISKIEFISNDGGVTYAVSSVATTPLSVDASGNWKLDNDTSSWSKISNLTDNKHYQIQVTVKETSASLVVESVSHTTPLLVDVKAPDAVNLNSNSDTVSKTELANGIAFATDVATPTTTDIQKISMTLAGKKSGDKLILDSTYTVSADISAQLNKTVGTVSGVNYEFNLATNTLTISKYNNGVFAAAEVEKIIEAIKLQNTETTPGDTNRTATFAYTDTAGNVGVVATATLIVDTAAPTQTISNIAISSDTGTSSTDFITKTKTQNITATLNAELNAGEKLYYRVDTHANTPGIENWIEATDKVSGVNVNIQGANLAKDTDTDPDTKNKILFKVVDEAGNESTVEGKTYELHDSVILADVDVWKSDSHLNGRIDIFIIFSQPVNGLTAPSYNNLVKVDGAAVSADFYGTNGTVNRLLSYTIVAGDKGALTIDKDALKTLLNDNIVDLAGNRINVGTINIKNENTLPTNIDTVAPTLDTVTIQGFESNGTTEKTSALTTGDKIVVTVKASENINVKAPGTTYKIKIGAGSEIEIPLDNELVNGTELKFTYVVDYGDVTNESTYVAAVGLTIENYKHKDVAGNYLDNSTPPSLATGGTNIVVSAPDRSGGNTLYGTDNDDVITGYSYNDVIVASKGKDILTGGNGSDIFVFKSTDDTADVITDFQKNSYFDKLNLSDLLTYNSGDIISDFVNIEQAVGSNDLIVKVDANGTAGGANFVEIVTLQGGVDGHTSSSTATENLTALQNSLILV